MTVHVQHTSQAAGSACISDIIRDYMVNGTVSLTVGCGLASIHKSTIQRHAGNATVCEVDRDFEVFQGVLYSDILANMPSQDF